MKSKLTAYLLFFFLGALGAHRFYLEKIPSGLFYLFTGGFFGIGLIFDFFTLGAKVDLYNAQRGYYVNNPGINISINTGGEANRGVDTRSPDRQVLDLTRTKTELTAREVVLNTSLSLEEAEKTLAYFVEKGVATEHVTQNGKICYNFK